MSDLSSKILYNKYLIYKKKYDESKTNQEKLFYHDKLVEMLAIFRLHETQEQLDDINKKLEQSQKNFIKKHPDGANPNITVTFTEKL